MEKPEDMSSGLSMMALNIRKAFINARRVNSAKFGWRILFYSTLSRRGWN